MVRSLLFVIFLSSLSLFGQQGQGWFQRANVPGPARHRSVAVAIGDRVYTGLGHVNAVVDILYDDWWEFDPGTNSWTQKVSYPGGPTHHAFGFTIGNVAYVGTGRNQFGQNTTSFYSYDPLTNSWSPRANFAGTARRGAVGFSIGNYGYAGTGNTSMSGYTNDMWRYNPTTNQWNQIASFPGGNRFAAIGFSIGNKGYLGTGEQSNPPAGSKNDLWEYDPATNFWIQRANVPGLPRLAACAFSVNGWGYVGTGEDFQSGNNYSDFHAYNPSTNTWTSINDFEGIARRYMVGVGTGSHAFVGFGTNGTNYNDWWEFGYMSGVEESSSDQMLIYPNPATDQIHVNTTPGSRMLIRGMKGELIKEINVTNESETIIQIEELTPGIYFICVEVPGQRSLFSKFVKH